MRKVVEQKVAPNQRDQIKVTFAVGNRDAAARRLSYAEILAELQTFEYGIPECSTCPISSGRPLGCYRYITYPVDETFERLVFEFVVSQIQTTNSISEQLYSDVFSRIPSSGTIWHSHRNGEGIVAKLPQPLKYEWGESHSRKYIDSAQILGGLFLTLDQPPLVAGYALFWSQLATFAAQQGIGTSPTFLEVLSMYPMIVAMTPIAVSEGGVIYTDS